MSLTGRTVSWWVRLRRPCLTAAPRGPAVWLPTGLAACQRFYSSRDKEKIDMSAYPVESIRNFSIIAHVDHGKSTLADRLLEITGTIAKTDRNKQVLDKLQVERERGITVKAQSASLFYNYKGVNYLLNLIDTPGHVDFNYEVSRSLSACQGVLLVVDANEGIQAQTVANFYLAFEAQLAIIPVINKISAKQGTNIDKVLEKVIEKIPPPQCNTTDPLKALVFDSTFDHYRGVVANIAVFGGEIQKGHRIVSAHTNKRYEVNEVGILTPNEQPTHKLLGFLGLLHMEVFNQRLEQEYNTSVILTAPTVPYKAVLSSAKLIKDRRAVQKEMLYIDEHRVMLKYLFPLNEIVVDFYDALKSLSSGYASFDYEDAGYQAADLIKMDILINGNPVEELSTIIHNDKAYATGKYLCERLKDAIPRQLFEIAIQAAIGKKIIARETLKAYRKNVVAKCYGGDITRRMKLLKRQAEGKKLMRKIGNVEVPRDAFIRVLKRQPEK